MKGDRVTYREVCKKCSLKSVKQYCTPEYKRRLRKKDPRKSLWSAARARARKKGLSFDITFEDVVIPKVCPLLNIPIEPSSLDDGVYGPLNGSPSIDRKDNNKGYTRDNIWIISHRANTAKGNLTLSELEILLSNIQRVLYKQGELLETPEADNQQPSLSSNTLEGSTTNSRVLKGQ